MLPRQTRSFCYVDDLIEGFVALMQSPDHFTGPVNMGNPTEINVHELAELIRSMTGSNSRIIYKSLPMDDPIQRQPDISKANSVLDWKPEISLEEGLEKTITYFKQQLALSA